MKTLHLNLKRKWFDMILSGEKTEEYRDLKDYWFKRFGLVSPIDANYYFKKFDTITFKNGYQKNAPTFTIECLGIEIGKAKPEWSDNWKGDVFVIKLGKIISLPKCPRNNITRNDGLDECLDCGARNY